MAASRFESLLRKLFRAGLFAVIGWMSAIVPGLGDAEAAPYCLLRKPQFGRPPNCFEFYLADTARTDAGLRAIVVATAAGPACTVTPIAARESWLPDAMFPGPHADWRTGDLAMHAASPYHQDAYGCRAAAAGATTLPPLVGGGVAGPASQCPAPGNGCQLQQLINQPESRDGSGRLTVEAALIHVLNCPGTGTTYVYQYQNRRAFRAVRPPNWSNAIGGGDFGTCAQAQAAAATGANQGPAAGGGYYVFALKDIGLVVATPKVVRTRPVCHWTGGGSAPCQAPASVLGALGGPYPTEDAARADMRTKLDCQRGHWGTFIPYGADRAWLQNNLTGSDCRSMRQL